MKLETRDMKHLDLIRIRHLFLFILVLGMHGVLYSQECAVEKGASIIAGRGSFTVQGGDIFEDSFGNKSTTVSLTPTFSYFIKDNLYVGGGFEISNQTQGSLSINGIGIGPHIGYAFGNSNSTFYPYVDSGLRYYNMIIDSGILGDSNLSGMDIFLDGGILMPIKDHIGLTVEAGYHLMNLKESSSTSFSGILFSIGVGIVGLIY